MSMMPPASETVPGMQPAPLDQQPLTLQDHLDQAIAMIAKDGALTDDEMTAVSMFLQQVQMIGQAKQANGQLPGGPTDGQIRGNMQNGGFGAQQERQVSPYGQSQNPNVTYGGR